MGTESNLDLTKSTLSSEQDLLRASALSEIVNIGVGHAARSMSEMVGRTFKISVPRAITLLTDNLDTYLPQSDDLYSVVYMAKEGEFSGRIALLFDWPSCQILISMLVGSAPETPEELTELEWSSIIETGNILNGAFLCAFTDYTGLQSNATPPMLAIDGLDSIMSSIAIEAEQDHIAIFIEAEIFDDISSFKGSFIVIPSKESIERLWGALGLNMENAA
jgi:chemotaxis protein CheC